jgi:GT2 family glycosyltransferase
MLVSVITPTYNRASFLPETIGSVLAQHYRPIEHIVVDDGSTDGTPDVLARYPGLVVIRQSNSGEPAAVNEGLARARGEIVVIVNSDDPLRPDAIRRAVETFAQHPDALMAYPDWEEIDADGKIIRTLNLPDGLDFERLLRTYEISIGPATFFRSEAIRRVGPRRLDRRFTGDLDLWMRIAAVGRLVHIPAVLGTHRVHDAAAMSTSKGWRMGQEVAQLAYDCLQMPHGLPGVSRDRRAIIANARMVASQFCGSNQAARFYHLACASLADPRVAVAVVVKSVKLRFKIAVVGVFRRAYGDPDLSVRRRLRGWFGVRLKNQPPTS